MMISSRLVVTVRKTVSHTSLVFSSLGGVNAGDTLVLPGATIAGPVACAEQAPFQGLSWSERE